MSENAPVDPKCKGLYLAGFFLPWYKSSSLNLGFFFQQQPWKKPIWTLIMQHSFFLLFYNNNNNNTEQFNNNNSKFIYPWQYFIARMLVGSSKWLKQIIQMKQLTGLRIRNWPEANQLAIYKPG